MEVSKAMEVRQCSRQLSDALVRCALSGFAMVGGWSEDGRGVDGDDDGEGRVGGGRVGEGRVGLGLKPSDFQVGGGAVGGNMQVRVC